MGLEAGRRVRISVCRSIENPRREMCTHLGCHRKGPEYPYRDRRLRTIPARPTRPVPKRPIVPGSGTVGGGVPPPVAANPVLPEQLPFAPLMQKWKPKPVIWLILLTPDSVNVSVVGNCWPWFNEVLNRSLNVKPPTPLFGCRPALIPLMLKLLSETLNGVEVSTPMKPPCVTSV